MTEVPDTILAVTRALRSTWSDDFIWVEEVADRCIQADRAALAEQGWTIAPITDDNKPVKVKVKELHELIFASDYGCKLGDTHAIVERLARILPIEVV